MKSTIFRRSGKRAAGFSLIETMVALGVLTVSSLGSVALMANSFMLTKDGRKRAQVAAVVEEAVSSMVAASSIGKDESQFYAALNTAAVRTGCVEGAPTCTSAGCPVCTKQNYRYTGLHIRTGASAPVSQVMSAWIEVESSFRPGLSRKRLFNVSLMVP